MFFDFLNKALTKRLNLKGDAVNKKIGVRQEEEIGDSGQSFSPKRFITIVRLSGKDREQWNSLMREILYDRILLKLARAIVTMAIVTVALLLLNRQLQEQWFLGVCAKIGINPSPMVVVVFSGMILAAIIIATTTKLFLQPHWEVLEAKINLMRNEIAAKYGIPENTPFRIEW